MTFILATGLLLASVSAVTSRAHAAPFFFERPIARIVFTETMEGSAIVARALDTTPERLTYEEINGAMAYLDGRPVRDKLIQQLERVEAEYYRAVSLQRGKPGLETLRRIVSAQFVDDALLQSLREAGIRDIEFIPNRLPRNFLAARDQFLSDPAAALPVPHRNELFFASIRERLPATPTVGHNTSWTELIRFANRDLIALPDDLLLRLSQLQYNSRTMNEMRPGLLEQARALVTERGIR